MRPCVDPASGGLPVSHVRHIAVHVHLPRVLPPRRPLHARLQHVPVAGGRRVRLRRQVRHEGGRVSSERTSHHPSALTISKRTKLLQYWQQKPLSHTCPVQKKSVFTPCRTRPSWTNQQGEFTLSTLRTYHCSVKLQRSSVVYSIFPFK